MDITLYYQEKGDKEPLILLHGNGQNGSYFKNQIDYFSDRYRVIALDTKGHGKSPRGTKSFTIEQFSCDLYEFMEDLEIPHTVILGFSDGANIAMEFAMKYPNKVKALILNGGNLNPRGVKGTTQIPIEIGYKIARRFASKSSGAKKSTEMLGLMVNAPNIALRELSKITAPTLAICGSSDIIKESYAKEIAENIPDAKLPIIKGNHFIANKRYVTFNKMCNSFSLAFSALSQKSSKKKNLESLCRIDLFTYDKLRFSVKMFEKQVLFNLQAGHHLPLLQAVPEGF